MRRCLRILDWDVDYDKFHVNLIKRGKHFHLTVRRNKLRNLVDHFTAYILEICPVSHSYLEYLPSGNSKYIRILGYEKKDDSHQTICTCISHSKDLPRLSVLLVNCLRDKCSYT